MSRESVTIEIDISTANALRRLREMTTYNVDADEKSLETVIFSLISDGFDKEVRQLREARDEPILGDDLSENRPPTRAAGFRDNRADYSQL